MPISQIKKMIAVSLSEYDHRLYGIIKRKVANTSFPFIISYRSL
ncbi:hypothetical protein RU86_GL002205 [Lactococcus piscium]|uniref:Uncharacterized protein n=1 Tax=Pseudolactococcus piscium TaxID=1364 RepID=A0A2A5RZT9_9LACT|nr:hypothetical protein RU86_GL002205 [Lactococcus piscium]